MSVSMKVDDNSLLISDETWKDLTGGNNSVAYANVKALAIGFVARGGNFIIHRDQENDSGVVQHFHRAAEVEELFNKVDEQRAGRDL